VERSKVYECQVHFGPVSFQKNAPPSPTCNHDQNVCDVCIRTDLEAKIRANCSRDFKCLDPECRKELSSARVRELIGPDCVKM